MEYEKRWEIVDEIGAGGQGKVYLVYDRNQIGLKQGFFIDLADNLKRLGQIGSIMDRRKAVQSIKKSFRDIVDIANERNHGALKVLHQPEDARDPDNAQDRIKNEIRAMSETAHPHLLKILDSDPQSKWYVSRYYRNGSLAKNISLFTRNIPAALKAFRPVVDAVAHLHKKGYVHRDIKPQNVFVDDDVNLILGDFGLVFFQDENHTRLSGTFENVGSRDWMPGWAYSMRVDEVTPSFDVFCLGKLLWSMVAGRPLLPLWYFDRAQYNIIQIFPTAKYARLLNRMFKQCIVENEKDCLQDAGRLLEQIDEILSTIEANGDMLEQNVERRCSVCGVGNYLALVDTPSDIGSMKDFGFDIRGGHRFKIFICNHCGHVQLFSFEADNVPPAWTK
jgi:serine/threonine protein kinase